MDTDIANRVITEITNRLGVGYSTFSNAVEQYAQTKATESLVISVVLFVIALLAVAIFFFVVVRDQSIELEEKVFCGFLILIVLLFVVIPGVLSLTDYINWSNAPQGMFLREITKSIN